MWGRSSTSEQLSKGRENLRATANRSALAVALAIASITLPLVSGVEQAQANTATCSINSNGWRAGCHGPLASIPGGNAWFVEAISGGRTPYRVYEVAPSGADWYWGVISNSGVYSAAQHWNNAHMSIDNCYGVGSSCPTGTGPYAIGVYNNWHY